MRRIASILVAASAWAFVMQPSAVSAQAATKVHRMTCEETFRVPGYSNHPSTCPPMTEGQKKTGRNFAFRDAANRAARFLVCPKNCPTLYVKSRNTDSQICRNPDKVNRSGDEYIDTDVTVAYGCKK
ncbi:MAG: hypothetical protein F9K43_12255 [Bauldia sp.]|jgi:hypothetical protein|nr:MAG: hypothetical protein F9K43_12255 [Bauldia sp.]MBZ0227545.1 hypothetical protein [Bauldia sp.]